jgi:N-acetylglucosamine-6-phosphate deacetylase
MRNGEIWLKDGSSLAGSSLTMLRGLKNAVAFTGYSLERLLPSATQVPARQIGVSDRKGRLNTGMDADFLILDHELTLRSTYVMGREVFTQ